MKWSPSCNVNKHCGLHSCGASFKRKSHPAAFAETGVFFLAKEP